MKWNKALVTGGAGFIGSHIVDTLVKDGIDTRVIDDLSSGFKENLDLDKVEFVEGDISNLDVVQKAVSDVDVIFHIDRNAALMDTINPGFGIFLDLNISIA